ncbi:MAG TPA: hypothetical protein VNE82_12730 [Candidatus Binataceae bacterium]|nr:hypothetical protein [Candidatus Binataceae bacterium]HVB80796.1 hypothetical protein [Candidatus Binataceae bacterium]
MSCERIPLPGGGVAVVCGARGRRAHHSSCRCGRCERRRELARTRARRELLAGAHPAPPQLGLFAAPAPAPHRRP